MTEYMTEQEQIEQLKSWLKQYGPTIIAGIFMALVFVTAWHWWENRTNRILLEASSIYDNMLNARYRNEPTNTATLANKLIKDYPRTPYATMAAMVLSHEATITKNYPAARKQLAWVIQHSNDASIREIAKIRNARILIEENQPQEALNTLKKIDDKNFQSLIDEVRGDAYLSLKNLDKAKEFYQLALQELPKVEINELPLLQMKLDNLSPSPDATA